MQQDVLFETVPDELLLGARVRKCAVHSHRFQVVFDEGIKCMPCRMHGIDVGLLVEPAYDGSMCHILQPTVHTRFPHEALPPIARCNRFI